jgi:predicted ATPase/transcriptional regulator with XRE-family HTH domain
MATARTASFGDVLRRYRRAAGLTQEELAARAGLSPHTISALERGVNRAPHHDTVTLLAEALALAPDDHATLQAAGRQRTHALVVLPVAGPAPPPLRARPPHNLPAPLTPLIGRERDVAATVALLCREDVRLVALTGPGGVGKTRLALQVAEDVLDRFDAGICLVNLAPVRDAALVATAIAQALGTLEGESGLTAADLPAYLREKRLLLLLDNFEQVMAAGSWLAGLLAACPQMKGLVTSRAALHVRGEWDMLVAPLDAEAASALFMQRAQAVGPDDFGASSASTAPVVREICERLDRLPLAIELAAARVRVLPLPLLLDRLARRLPLLTAGAADLPERQRTMRDTIAWSYELLDAADQQLFRRLAVFVDGCALEAAEAICGDAHGPQDRPVLDSLTALIEHSLVRAETTGEGNARFTMLETIREFALEALEASGEAKTLQRRHAEYLTRWAEPIARIGPGLGLREELVGRELANARAALAWARERGEAALGLRLAAAFGRIWFVRGLFAEGREWLEEMLARTAGADDQAVPVTVRLTALFGASQFALTQGDRSQAEVWARECLELAGHAGDQDMAGTALTILAAAAQAQGDLVRATALYEESLARYREAGTKHGVGRVMINLGNLWRIRGNYARAAALLQEAELESWESGSSWATANSLTSLGHLARDQGDLSRAIALYRESLPLFREIGNKGYLALCLEGLAIALLGQGRYERTATLCAAAAALRAAARAPLPKPEQEAYDRTVASSRAALGDAAFARAWQRGQALSLDEIVANALSDDEIDGR